MRLPKPILVASLVLFCGPILILLTLTELAGLFIDFILTGSPDWRAYELSDERFATIDTQGKLTWWPKECLALSGYHEDFATYCESAPYRSGQRYDLPVDVYGGVLSGGFIDDRGNKLPLKMQQVFQGTYLSEGLAPVFDPYMGKYCFVDKSGKQQIAQYFEDARAFSDGLAAVSVARAEGDFKSKLKNGKWGYIDKSGRFVIPASFTRAGQFNAGRAVVAELGKPDNLLVINKQGKIAFKNKFVQISDYSRDGIAIFNDYSKGAHVEDLDKVGLVDVNGKIVLRGTCFDNFADGAGTVCDGAYKGLRFANQQGQTVFQSPFGSHNYSNQPQLREGLVAVSKDCIVIGRRKYAPCIGRMFFVDKTGKALPLPLGNNRIISAAFPFNDGRAVIRTYIAKEMP